MGNPFLIRLVGFIGVAGVIFAFGAEITRVKARDVTLIRPDICVYPKSPSPAKKLAYIASLLLLVAQILITAALACCVGRRKNSSKIIAAITCFILSWVSAVVAIGILISAANLSTRQGFIPSKGRCYTVPSSSFKLGAFLGFVACFLGQESYESLMKKDESSSSKPDQEQHAASVTPYN